MNIKGYQRYDGSCGTVGHPKLETRLDHLGVHKAEISLMIKCRAETRHESLFVQADIHSKFTHEPMIRWTPTEESHEMHRNAL